MSGNVWRIPRPPLGIAAVLAIVISLPADAGHLVSGPMLGHRAHREVTLWLETEDARSVTIDYWLAGNPGTKRTITFAEPPATPAGRQIINTRLGLLEMGAIYRPRLRLKRFQSQLRVQEHDA
ncbi:MAG TPA: hypothetical protein VGA56_22605 [Opitutaceae bacterium]